MKKYFYISLAVFSVFIFNSVTFANAAEEIDAYCAAPTDAVPHGSTVTLAIKFSDSDKSNDFIAQGPFKVLQYKDKVPVVVDFKRGNEKDDKGKENTDKPTLTFSVALSPKHKMPVPATEAVTLTYFVKHKEGKRGSLHTTEREQQVDCSFTVQHEVEKGTTPSGENPPIGDPDFDLLRISNVGTLPTSKWYFLKEWRRGISRLFTFNTTARAELELKITDEKAVEVMALRETKLKGALEKAFANYTDAAGRLEARLSELKETSENPNVEKLLKKLNEQTLQHALLLNQIAERWQERHLSDPYAEDTMRTHPQATKDNHLQGAVDVMQKKIQDIAILGAEKDKNIKEKAQAQIKRAEEAITELKVRIDSTPARISTNLTIERQTPKRDFGDRMKAGLETAGGVLANGKTAFAEGKYGEAFGHAREAEVLARNDLRALIHFESGFTIPASDGSSKESARKIPPPETNNVEAACPGDHGPACEAPKISECHNGKWICVGPASGVPKIPTVKEPSACGQIRCLMYQPVCGTNGKTYSCGEADALSCGVKVAYAGECKIVTPAPTVKPIDGMACTQQYDPVCGIDGKTYGNTCMANIAGISIAHKGECGALPVETACSLLLNPVCGIDGKTYSNECFAKLAGASVAFQGACNAVPIETQTGTIAPTRPSAVMQEFTLEADDLGFYPEPTIIVLKGSQVKIHFIVRTVNVYYGGLDFRSSKFPTVSAKPGGVTDVSFVADESFVFTSYWPLSGVQKSSGKVVVQ